MNPLPSNNLTNIHLHVDHNAQSARSLLASTLHILEQPSPPSLREVLNAYKSNGDGDRDMLLAILNAKSAEDQRIANLASLHKTMLEYTQNIPGPQLPQLHTTERDTPHPYPSPPVPMTHSPREMRDHPDHLSNIHPSLRGQTSSENSRKRARRSRSPQLQQPPRPERRRQPDFQSNSQHELPPSPFSSVSRSRRSSSSDSNQSQHNKSMAIDSLLSSTSKTGRENEDGIITSEINMSSSHAPR